MAEPIPAEPAARARTGYDRRWDEHNARRREQILRAAAELVEESPPGAPIPVRLIADRAGVVKSALYRQFRGKEELARGLRGHVVDLFAAELEADLDISRGSLRAILGRAIGSAATWMRDHPRLVELLRAGPSDRDRGTDRCPDAMAELKQRVVLRSRGIIDAIAVSLGLPPAVFDELPVVVFGMVEAALTGWVRDEPGLRGRTRTEVVASLTDLTWFILDGAARTQGLRLDPDRELVAALAEARAGADAAAPGPVAT